jgi:hypothetical protein
MHRFGSRDGEVRPKKRMSKRTIFIRYWRTLGLLLLLVTVACRGGAEGLDDIMVDLAIDPDPPRLGPATLTVTLHDTEGEPVVGAEMSLEGNMNHAGMVPVLAKAIEISPGRYEAPLEFTMGGDWFVLVQALLSDGRSLEQKFDVPAVDATCGTPAP